MFWDLLVFPAFLIWLIILLLPWRPWSTREVLDTEPGTGTDLGNVTVLIPARNEAHHISQTLGALAAQDPELKIILVDDQSTDNTIEEVDKIPLKELRIVSGKPVPPGWSGKLWAMQQGLEHVTTDYILLLDADIRLLPGMIPALLDKLVKEQNDLVSVMARLRMENFWEKLLMPAFIYFFKLLYPFHLSNSSSQWIAAAAGGCILVRHSVIKSIGGFNSFKNSLIDDCTLARTIKLRNGITWTGLTHSAISMREYKSLTSIWDTVARTAYTQLHHSLLLVVICTIIMVYAFVVPCIGLFTSGPWTTVLMIITLLIMFTTYLPTLKFYSLNLLWTLWLPVIGILYLAMTWTSVYRHAFSGGATWKDRNYATPE